MHPRLLLLASALSFPAAALAQISCVPPGAEARFLGEESGVDSIGFRFGLGENGQGYVPGVVAGFAFRFDGVDDYVHVPEDVLWHMGWQDFTLELWARFDSATAADPLLAHSDGPGPVNKWILQKNAGGQNLALVLDGTVQQTLSIPMTWTAGHWYHLVLTRSGTDWTFYVDGVARGTVSALLAVPDATGELWIGGNGTLAGLCTGAIDDVWFWRRALTPADVQLQYREQARRCMFLSLGSGCATPQYRPVLSAPQGPRIGQMFMFDFSDLYGNAQGALLIGGSNERWGGVRLPLALDPLGMPTCRLMVSADLVLPLGPVCGCGHTVWLYQIPNAPELVGVEFYAQSFFTDPAANPAGLLASNAGCARIEQ